MPVLLRPLWYSRQISVGDFLTTEVTESTEEAQRVFNKNMAERLGGRSTEQSRNESPIIQREKNHNPTRQ
jgi:hypothetical protein